MLVMIVMYHNFASDVKATETRRTAGNQLVNACLSVFLHVWLMFATCLHGECLAVFRIHG